MYYSYIIENVKSELDRLCTQIGLSFASIEAFGELFEEAFTHRSVGTDTSNERLEFLGDAVLELITTEYLYNAFPDKPEGDLTNYRSALVKRENLAHVARKLDMGKILKMSKGEAASGGREKDYLLANVMESFIGALYLSVGVEEVQSFIADWIIVELDDILAQESHIDPKSALQELTQGDYGITPSYETIGEKGLDHEKIFEVAVFMDELQVGSGKGNSKKEAQASAAASALEVKDDWIKKLK